MTDESELDFGLLSPELQGLAPFISKYGEGDDLVREELLSGAPADELARIITATDPHWDSINEFLNENMEEIGPRQDLAVALDAFAQAALEAQTELESRQ